MGTTTAKGKYPWQGCVSDDWIQQEQCGLSFQVDDESVNILKIRLPDELFSDPSDPLWLGQMGDDA
jgi:hypothetical protein